MQNSNIKWKWSCHWLESVGMPSVSKCKLNPLWKSPFICMWQTAWSFSSHVVKLRKLLALWRNNVVNLNKTKFNREISSLRRMKTPTKGIKREGSTLIGHYRQNTMQNSIASKKQMWKICWLGFLLGNCQWCSFVEIFQEI